MFGLSEETIIDIRRVFSKNERIEKVIIYGSRAKGNYRKGSDIDITLIGEDLNLNNSIYPLMDDLDDLLLPYLFDISIFTHIEDKSMIEHINRVGRVFYER